MWTVNFYRHVIIVLRVRSWIASLSHGIVLGWSTVFPIELVLHGWTFLFYLGDSNPAREKMKKTHKLGIEYGFPGLKTNTLRTQSLPFPLSVHCRSHLGLSYLCPQLSALCFLPPAMIKPLSISLSAYTYRFLFIFLGCSLWFQLDISWPVYLLLSLSWVDVIEWTASISEVGIIIIGFSNVGETMA